MYIMILIMFVLLFLKTVQLFFIPTDIHIATTHGGLSVISPQITSEMEVGSIRVQRKLEPGVTSIIIIY